jgi:hypothetical protein
MVLDNTVSFIHDELLKFDAKSRIEVARRRMNQHLIICLRMTLSLIHDNFCLPFLTAADIQRSDLL